MEKATETDIHLFLSKNQDWKIVDAKWLERKYRFKTYLDGIQFVHQIAQLAENANHHPFISIDYKLVKVRLSTWKANGITELDFQLAKQFDSTYVGE